MLKIRVISESLKWLTIFIMFFVISACGTGGLPDATTTQGGGAGETGAAVTPSNIELLASSSLLLTDGTSSVTLTAIVKDSKMRALAGQQVDFSASSGTLLVTSATTDDSGQATAILKVGTDKSNRTIAVTATSGSVSATTEVTTTGTTIEISGPSSLSYGSTGTYTVTLKDAGGTGIGKQKISLSCVYNTLSSSTVITDANGQATFTLTATDTQDREDTVTASAMGAGGGKVVQVITTTFRFDTPETGANIEVDTWQNVTVFYGDTSGPKVGKTVNFTTSRGQLNQASATTDANGKATVQIRSSYIGYATVNAWVNGGPAANLDIEFVSSTPASLTLLADPEVININKGSSTTNRSTILARIKDNAGNPVKNKKVSFSLTKDPSSGSLSPATATTNSLGEASIYYIAGSASSGAKGVEIAATVDGTGLSKTINLTVAGEPFFISLGTGNKISSEGTTTYLLDYTVLVTDQAGHPVEGVVVTSRLIPIAYLKGYFDVDAQTNKFIQVLTLQSSHPNPAPYADPILPNNYCGNEDLRYYGDPDKNAFALNGYLDPEEDFNGNEALDPGNQASVNQSVTTDANGLGTFSIRYTKSYAPWIYVRLEVTAKVSGTEGKAYSTFLLPYAVGDYSVSGAWPPDSPFGKSATCSDTN